MGHRINWPLILSQAAALNVHIPCVYLCVTLEENTSNLRQIWQQFIVSVDGCHVVKLTTTQMRMRMRYAGNSRQRTATEQNGPEETEMNF